MLVSIFLESWARLPRCGPGPGRDAWVCSSALAPGQAPAVGLPSAWQWAAFRTTAAWCLERKALVSNWAERRGFGAAPARHEQLPSSSSSTQGAQARVPLIPRLRPGPPRDPAGSLHSSSSCLPGWVPWGPDWLSHTCGLMPKGGLDGFDSVGVSLSLTPGASGLG